MSVPRRRLIRPPLAPTASPERPRNVQKLRERLEKERLALARWQTKLKRAFNATEKCQRKIARLERTITNLEE